ncbi:hypothetical protein B0H14DRAFT_3557369 [Mycena olivaceomarginata]|nr:hypothetical protein B0H14DRAFT_3557369 [Mycena olivaceomarginata]
MTRTEGGAAAREHASGRDGTASPGGHPPRAQNGGCWRGHGRRVGEDGKWFQALDERRGRSGAEGATRATVVGAHRDEAWGYQYSASAEQGDSGSEAGARISEHGVAVECVEACTRPTSASTLPRPPRYSAQPTSAMPGMRAPPSQGAAAAGCDTLVDADPEVEVEVAKEVEDTGVQTQAYPGRGGSWSPWTKCDERNLPCSYCVLFMLVRVVCNSKPAQQPSPERLFTLAYTTALSGMHGDKDECERLQGYRDPWCESPGLRSAHDTAAGLRR